MEAVMFIGRTRELSVLRSLSASPRFEYLVLYGRRRVGKTTLLLQFMKTQPVIFYAAQAKNDALNLVDFSKAVHHHYDRAYYAPFSDWQAAFSYIGEQESERRTIVVIDEFPYIAETNPTIQSILQHTIDHRWKEKNIFLILCGSSVSFMQNDVMGSKSPLFGRSTAILELKGFDYLESSLFFPTYDVSDKLLSYAILGGIPTYLQAFDPKKSIQSNIAERILRMGAFLNNEPQNLLKMEIRESAVYNAILEAIATGSSRLNEIAQKIKEEPTKCSKYLSVLMNLKIVERITPSGKKESSKRSLYTIADNFSNSGIASSSQTGVIMSSLEKSAQRCPSGKSSPPIWEEYLRRSAPNTSFAWPKVRSCPSSSIPSEDGGVAKKRSTSISLPSTRAMSRPSLLTVNSEQNSSVSLSTITFSMGPLPSRSRPTAITTSSAQAATPMRLQSRPELTE